MLDYVAMRLALGGRSHRREVRCARTGGARAGGRRHCAERHWEELSDWERALVELAQAIAGTPRLLLIDDVLDGLGMRETDELARLVRALAEDRGIGRADGGLRRRGGALLAPRSLSLAAGA